MVIAMGIKGIDKSAGNYFVRTLCKILNPIFTAYEHQGQTETRGKNGSFLPFPLFFFAAIILARRISREKHTTASKREGEKRGSN